MAITPTTAEVERALTAILNSHAFAKSEKLRLLIEHLVTNMVRGKISELTEVNIAKLVFGRAEDFEPVENSLVRKTMARLRDKLMTYYAGEGRSAEVRIELERGGYLPTFVHKQEWHIPQSLSRAPRVLVLPFHPVNFRDEEFFGDSLLEDLMIALAAGGSIPIVPWTTARYLREMTGDMREYYRVSGADVILDGSIRRVGNDAYQLTLSWVDGLTAVFDAYLQVTVSTHAITEAIQSLCMQIAQRLGTAYSSLGIDQIEARQSLIPEARNFYLRARQANRLGTAEGVRQSFAYVARALHFQPDFAAALALKADTHIFAAVSGLYSARAEMAAAIEAAQAALRSAPKLAPALAAKGGVQFAFQWDNVAAAKTLGSARALDATSDSYHFWSEAVLASEDPAGAAAKMEQYAEDDSCSAATAYLASSYCYNARQWNRTEHWARKAIELDPNFFRPYPFLAGAFLETDRPGEALETAELARRVSGPNAYTSGMLGLVLARSGRLSEARALLTEANAFGKAHGSAMGRAAVCAALGEKEQACDAVEQMIENREPYVSWLGIFPFFDCLRGYRRFDNLLASREIRLQAKTAQEDS